MRTRTNLYFGQGIEGAVRAVKSLFPAGMVTVIAEDADEGALYAELLSDEGYDVDVFPVDATVSRVGFYLGVGGEKAVLRTIASAPGKFGFCPTEVLPELFAPDGRGKYPEFCYFDTDLFSTDAPSAVFECHAGLMTVFTEGLATLYRECGAPYGDRALSEVLSRAKRLLLGGADRENYFSEVLSSIKAVEEVLNDRGVTRYTAADMARILGGGAGKRGVAAYFLNLLLILFTKWNFRDMLIPSESASGERTAYAEDDLILDRKDLSKAAAWVKKTGAKPEIKELVAAMKSAVAGKNSLFAEIFVSGLPEGLIGYGGSA